MPWRVTSAALRHDFFSELRDDRRKLAVAGRVLALLLRLVNGEEASPEFFALVMDGLRFLSTVPESSLANAECLIVLRLLRHLGYIGDSSEKLEGLLASSVWTDTELGVLAPHRRDAVAIINAALKETQL